MSPSAGFVPTVPTNQAGVGTNFPQQDQRCSDRSDRSDHNAGGGEKKRIPMRELAARLKTNRGEIPLSDSLSRHEYVNPEDIAFSANPDDGGRNTRNTRNIAQYQSVAGFFKSEQPTIESEQVGTSPDQEAPTALMGDPSDMMDEPPPMSDAEWASLDVGYFPARGIISAEQAVVVSDKARHGGALSFSGLLFHPGIAPEWEQGLARMIRMHPPREYPTRAWENLLADATDIVRDHAAEFLANGWTTLDLFGADPDAPFAATHSAGLALILRGYRVAGISATEARLETETGASLTFRKRANTGAAVPVWNLPSRPEEAV